MTNALPILALVALAACTAPEVRLATPQIDSDVSVRTSFPSLEMRLVSLPTYAGAEEISIQQADGTITSGASLLWADDPARAVTLALSRHLSLITGATVAPEPWPFDAYASGRVDVRFTDMLARSDNQFQIAGQYFVVDSEGRGRDRAVLFDIQEPVSAPFGPAQAADARARAIANLAAEIAQKAL
ncbi:membrane integrity-associated transporter subunit PqiC [Donghicola sp. XS_ASV15]|uniref:PqiC family protein n=1 Tax=Donghicola sp. XS_ASV15 TaxID=3241295 RepID=UPI0035118296